MVRVAAIVVLSVSLAGIPALAAEADNGQPAAAGAAIPAGAAARLAPPRIGPTPRPAALPALYVSLAALQIFDGVSTARGLALGAREANPLMAGASDHPIAFWATKAAATAVPMVLAERMWKRHRAGAIIVMALANGVVAAVAANNARVLARQSSGR